MAKKKQPRDLRYNIYSDIRGEVFIAPTVNGIHVQIYDVDGGRRKPTLILPNRSAVESLRDWLNEVLEIYERE